MGNCSGRDELVNEDVVEEECCEFEQFRRQSYGYYGGHYHGLKDTLDDILDTDYKRERDDDVFIPAREGEKLYYDADTSTCDDQVQSSPPCADHALDEYEEWDIIELDLKEQPQHLDPNAADDMDARRLSQLNTIPEEDVIDTFPTVDRSVSMPEPCSSHHDRDHDMGRPRYSSSCSIDSFMSDTSAVSNNSWAWELYNDQKPTRLQIYMKYHPRTWRLSVGVKQAECALNASHRGKRRGVYWQVHMTLFPYKRHRYKTCYKSSLTPIFNQSFDIDEIASHALCQMSVRYRVYGRFGRTGRKKLAGEVDVGLGALMKADNVLYEWRVLHKGLVAT